MQTDFWESAEQKEQKAINAILLFEPSALARQPDGYWLAFSGGKDSVVLLDLAKRSGVKFKAFYNVTTIDPPELVKFIKKQHPDVIFNRPQKIGMIEMAANQKGMPSRLIRWCCEEYKHTAGAEWVKLLGVRRAESVARKARWQIVTPPMKKGDGEQICPIAHWTDEDIWAYIRRNNVAYCSLYDEGFKRLGCVGCPMAGKFRHVEFQRWPIFKKMWQSAANRYWEKFYDKPTEKQEARQISKFKSGKELFDWWMADHPSEKKDSGQCQFGQW